MSGIHTMLRVHNWEQALSGHSDQVYVAYLLRGMHQGFRIGFDCNKVSLKSASRNIQSAVAEPGVVDAYLAKEQEAARVVGPMSKAQGAVHISCFGVIPKPHQPRKWRLIVDLSHPAEKSVNNGVVSEWCSLAYTSIDEAAAIILRQGRFAELAKVNIASAYQIMLVHLQDWPPLGMVWTGQAFVDTALPFGLRSTPKLFTVLADGLELILWARGSCEVIHYQDDYLSIGNTGSSECSKSLHLAVSTCTELGIPLALEKQEGPAHQLVFLGVELDSTNLELRFSSGC